MRIDYQDKRYIIDTCTFAVFLQEQGFTGREILQLIIHVRVAHKKDPTLYGEFKRPYTTYLYTRGKSYKEVNATLLHETGHYWQAHQRAVEREQRQREYEGMRKGRKKELFYYTYLCWGDTTTREADIEYWDRPSEIAARDFAEKHASHQFVRYQQLYVLPVPCKRLTAAQKDLLKKRTKRLSSTEDETHIQFSHLTIQEAESLTGFLQQFGLHFKIPRAVVQEPVSEALV